MKEGQESGVGWQYSNFWLMNDNFHDPFVTSDDSDNGDGRGGRIVVGDNDGGDDVGEEGNDGGEVDTVDKRGTELRDVTVLLRRIDFPGSFLPSQLMEM